jgi:hypothetical protein
VVGPRSASQLSAGPTTRHGSGDWGREPAGRCGRIRGDRSDNGKEGGAVNGVLTGVDQATAATAAAPDDGLGWLGGPITARLG